MECTICHKEIEYYAIGNNCDHILCSICRVRISFKLSDHSCPLCKITSPFHVIAKIPSNINNHDNNDCNYDNNNDSSSSSSSNEIKLFSDYNLWVGKNADGVIYDEKTGYHYINCPEHSVTISNLLSITCKICNNRYRSLESFKTHIWNEHSRRVCNLCVSHRPKFVIEQKLFTDNQLKNHKRGMTINSSSE